MSEALDRAIGGIEGVASAHVETHGSTVTGVKVTLEEGADERMVGLAIRRVLETHGYRSRVAPERAKVEPQSAPMPPVEIDTQPVDKRRARLESVTVEEDRAGATVTIVDTAGTAVTRSAGTTRDGRRRATVDAVAALIEPGAALRLVEVTHREDGVLLVVLEDTEGTRLAGAAVVRSGFDFAMAAAVWAALGSRN